MLESILGWLGAGLYLLAHGWISILKRSAGKGYYLINFCAAAFVVVSSVMLSSWQPVLINMFWAVVSFAALCHFRLPSLFLTNRHLLWWVSIAFCIGSVWFLFDRVTGLYILAWSSVVAFCLPYWRYSTQKLSQRSYFVFSGYAAFVLLPQLYLDENWPVFVLEILWGSLSVIGYVRLRRLNHVWAK